MCRVVLGFTGFYCVLWCFIVSYWILMCSIVLYSFFFLKIVEESEVRRRVVDERPRLRCVRRRPTGAERPTPVLGGESAPTAA